MTQPPNIISLALRQQRLNRLLVTGPVTARLDAIATRMNNADNGIPDAWLGAEMGKDWAVGRSGP